MADNISTYTTRIFLNDEEAQKKIDTFKQKIADLRKDQEQALTISGSTGDKKWKEAAKQIKQYEAQIKKLSTTSQQVGRVLSDLSGSSVKELKATVAALNKELSNGTVKRNSDEWKFLTEQLRRCRTELQNIDKEAGAAKKAMHVDDDGNFFSKTVDMFNKNWGFITQAWAGITGLSDTIRQTTQAFADMEEAMANVRKYTGQTDEEIHAMNEEFKGLDTRTSREQLNELAGAAGRLGITAHDDIMEFVDAADKINVALGDDLGEGAVDQIGKLAMAFGESDKMGLRAAMLATGSAVNELAQNSSANAGYLVDFAARLSGVGKQAGLTQAQIMGLGSVMDENMQRDEMASTALSQLITKMVTDTKTFAKMAGEDVKEFSDLVTNDMNAALLKFFEAMNKKGGFKQLAPMFADMGLDGTRATQVLSVFADKVERVRQNQELATQAYRDATSVGKEFEVQNNTVQANLDKAKKSFHDIAVELGGNLMPIVTYTINGGSMLVKVMAKLTSFALEHSRTLGILTTAIALYTVQMKASIVMDKLKVLWSGYVVKGLKILYTTMMQNPYLAVAAGILTVIAYYQDWLESINKVSQAEKDLKKINEEAARDAMSEKDKLKDLYYWATAKASSDTLRAQAIKELNELSPEYLGWLNKENINTQAAKNAIDAYTRSIILNTKAKRLAEKLEDLDEQKKSLNPMDYTRWYDSLQTGVNDIADKIERTVNGVAHVLGGNGSFSKGWEEDTKAGEYALNATEAAATRYRMAVNEVTEEEIALRKELKKTNQQILENKTTMSKAAEANTPTVGDGGSGTTYVSEKERKKQERERKAREKAAKEAKENDVKTIKAKMTSELTTLATSYDQGRITYQQYLDERERMTLEYLQKQKDAWGKDSNEAKQLEDDELKAKREHADAIAKLNEQEIERARSLTAAKLKAQFYDPDSDIFQNEEALNEALFQNDQDALQKRIDLQAKGSKEWLELRAEKEQQDSEHQLEREIATAEKRRQLREQYGEADVQKQEQIALAGLDSLYPEELRKTEEYLKTRQAIIAYYAQLAAQTDAEYWEQQANEKGAGSNTRRFNERVNTGLNRAKAEAGDVSDPDSDNAMDVLFGNDFKNWQNINTAIAELEQDGVLSHAEANAAKAQNDAEYLSSLMNKVQAAYNSVNTIVSAASAYSQACSDYEVAKITADYDKQIEAAGNNSSKKEKLEKKKDEAIAKAKTKANAKAMKVEMAQALAQTAMGAINAYTSTLAGAPYPANLVLAPISAGIAIAAGMLQVATIKKQHQAEALGYYEGGFTGGSQYRKEAGVVHQGEFVANHQAVGNSSILPALQLIDYAQKHNTVSSLTGEDVSRALGQGASSPIVAAPIVNVNTDNTALADNLTQNSKAIAQLNDRLSSPIQAHISMDELDREQRKYKRLNS